MIVMGYKTTFHYIETGVVNCRNKNENACFPKLTEPISQFVHIMDQECFRSTSNAV